MKLVKHLLLFVLICGTLACVSFIFSNPVHGVTKTLDVVLDDTYPPYIFYNEQGQPQGILVDQWNLFAKKTGIRVRLHPMAWHDAQVAMQTGKYDVIDTIFYTKERDKIYDFTDTYETIDTSIFFQTNISGITNIDSLKGFRVGVKEGDFVYDKLVAAGVKDIKTYSSYEEIVKAAASGELKIFIIDLPPGLYYLNKYDIDKEFKYTNPVFTEGFRRAVKAGDTATLAMINKGFAQIPQSQLNAIKTKWYGNQILEFKYLPQLLLGLGILVFLIIAAFVWNNLLRRKVKSHTSSLSAALDSLQLEQSKLEALITSMPDLIYIVDKSGFVKKNLSSKTIEQLMVDPQKLLYKNVTEVFAADMVARLLAGIDIAIQTGQSDAIELELDTEIGGKQFYEVRFARLSDEGAIAVVRNTTEKALATQQILNLSILDKLTDVYNRNFFEKTVNAWVNPEKDQTGIFMIDIDGLKLVNDTLGHDVGDQYLRTIAQVLKEVFPGPQTIFRIGGDEFAIVVMGWGESRMLMAKDQLIDQVRNLNAEGYPIPFSISIGFSLATPTCNTAVEMMKCADDYMYRQKLFHRQSERSKTIETLCAMLAERDFITQGHSKRMSHYIKQIARRVNFPDSQMPAIELFSDFHDIGKIGISDLILFKPNKLDAKEFADMKRHSEIGFRIAEASPDLLPISEWIYKHHENWDGSGYPFGISGKEIPLACRILSIVDAYDAMTNDRPYRKAMGRQEAVAELRRCAGTQFDPTLVEIFIDILQDEEEA